LVILKRHRILHALQRGKRRKKKKQTGTASFNAACRKRCPRLPVFSSCAREREKREKKEVAPNYIHAPRRGGDVFPHHVRPEGGGKEKGEKRRRHLGLAVSLKNAAPWAGGEKERKGGEKGQRPGPTSRRQMLQTWPGPAQKKKEGGKKKKLRPPQFPFTWWEKRSTDGHVGGKKREEKREEKKTTPWLPPANKGAC